jgi:hypothetical protein
MATDLMDGITFGMTNDPIPNEKLSRSQRRKQTRDDPSPRGPGRPSNNAIKKEVRDEIDAFIALMAVPIVMRDPTCGGVLMQQREQIAEALSEIAMKNPALLKFLRSGGDVMMYFKLVTALSPVAVTVYQHHFTSENHEQDGEMGYEFGPGVMG